MKFVKIKLGEETQWRLVLSTTDEVYRYHEIDIQTNFMGVLHKEHPRAETMNRILELGKACLKDGEKTTKLHIVANHQDKKTAGMIKAVAMNEICVNEVGGYCFLDGFLKLHKGEIIETIFKKDFGLPNENEVQESDLIILENSPSINTDFLNDLETLNIILPSTKRIEFTNLRQQDRSYVFKSIEQTKSIAMETQAIDSEQVNSFIKMFLGLSSKKNIYIRMIANKHILESHTHFEAVNQKHNIVFIGMHTI